MYNLVLQYDTNKHTNKQTNKRKPIVKTVLDFPFLNIFLQCPSKLLGISMWDVLAAHP